MLVSAMIQRVRENLHDDDGVRCTNERVIGAFNLAILDLRSKRPDYFIGRFNKPAYQIAAPTETYDLPEITIPMLINYATGWIELADEEVADGGRASAMMALYQAAIR